VPRIYLASTYPRSYLGEELLSSIPYVLESFYYFAEWQYPYLSRWKSFLLDSGAFTFMEAKNKKVKSYKEYTIQYANFVKDNNIKNFFEMDIDEIVGLEEVEKYRVILETIVGRQCIPVWHINRGKEYWLRMCREYKYIAWGAFLGEIKIPKNHRYVRWFTDTAREHGTDVHGLGYTGTEIMKYGFSSVDSSSWTSGDRFGKLFFFDGKRMRVMPQKGRLIGDRKQVYAYNLRQWLLYQAHIDSLGGVIDESR
jgi:hypothetical protein